MKKILLSLMILSLSGCASLVTPYPEENYIWKKVGPAKPFTWHQVPQEAVRAYCSHTNAFVFACSYWDHEQCWIFTSFEKENLPKGIIAHEEKHCKGYNHQVI